MQLRRELSLTLGSLVLLNVLLAFGVISLLVRMGPAIERILQENVQSIVAAEEILAGFAESDVGEVPASRRGRIEAAFARMRNNQTEAGELPILGELESRLDAALGSDAEARMAFVVGVRRLIQINRAAMARADLRAQRLGATGAWAAVLVGVLSFVLSLVVLARFRTRVVQPMLELHAALEAVRSGEPFRRCQTRAAPLELRQLLESVNGLLDERVAAKIDDARQVTTTD